MAESGQLSGPGSDVYSGAESSDAEGMGSPSSSVFDSQGFSTDVWLPEGPHLRQLLLPLGVALHPCPSPTLQDVLFHSSSDVTLLRTMHHIVAATDGSQTGHQLGAGVVLWHPSTGIFYVTERKEARAGSCPLCAV
mmetsp:Transcript_14815/g.23766  ORF Transcript_14815/g.23766 Transcript_14815/m.23766 type:complete len:136 (-) Transcript_14815:232-639(-)